MNIRSLQQSHPWHGVLPGPDAPKVVTCYIELVPTDTVKYEVDKVTGLLKVDRPQKYSNLCPMPYGFIPRTLCDTAVAERARASGAANVTAGDHDPMDICVLCERPMDRGGILLAARPIGGLRMIDKDEADDKIIAVLVDDAAFGSFQDIADVPQAMVDRLRHYFLTYKEIPGASVPRVSITEIYGAAEARAVIAASFTDYEAFFRSSI